MGGTGVRGEWLGMGKSTKSTPTHPRPGTKEEKLSREVGVLPSRAGVEHSAKRRWCALWAQP